MSDDLDILMGIESPQGDTILDLCSGSGSWSEPYRKAGYNVIEVTLPDTDVRLWPSGPSLGARLPNEFDDIRQYVGKVQGILAGPPCTYFSHSGNHIRRTDDDIRNGLAVADACIRLAYVLKPQWWVLENPIGKIVKWLGDPVHTFHPCDYGDPYTKLTYLWGRFFLPRMRYVTPTQGSLMNHAVRDPAERAITPPGFANAFFEANP